MADEIVARNNGAEFSIVPEGEYQAICVDTIDLGMHPNKLSGKLQHKVALVFQLGVHDPESELPYEVASRFTNSMYDTAYLRKFLGQWRGKSYSDDEAEQGAPLHKLVGVNAYITIEHNKVGEKTYANILSIRKLPPKGKKIEAYGYARAEYWEKVKEVGGLKTAKPQPAGVGAGSDEHAPLDESDPFPFS